MRGIDELSQQLADRRQLLDEAVLKSHGSHSEGLLVIICTFHSRQGAISPWDPEAADCSWSTSRRCGLPLSRSRVPRRPLERRLRLALQDGLLPSSALTIATRDNGHNDDQALKTPVKQAISTSSRPTVMTTAGFVELPVRSFARVARSLALRLARRFAARRSPSATGWCADYRSYGPRRLARDPAAAQ